VTVTSRGQTLLHEVKQARSERLRIAFGDITDEEIGVLLRLLDRICTAMAQQIEGREVNA